MNTPFTDFKTAEISPEKQESYFVEPKHIDKLISPKAAWISGERGSGKTTILRYLEKTFNHSEEMEYIGIYYRFETANVTALNNPEWHADKNIMMFSQYMAAILGKLLCGVLNTIKEERKIIYKHEYDICHLLSQDIELNHAESIDTYAQLAKLLERVRGKTVTNLLNGNAVCYFDYTTFLSGFCEELRHEEVFENTCFCVLFDEFENLTYTEQRVINSMVKASSYFLTYKVCMRPEGYMTKDTVAEREQLIFGHDYEEIDYVKDIIGKEKEVRSHLRQICANRLKYFYKKKDVQYQPEDLEIDSYLEFINAEKIISSWECIEEYKEDLKQKLCQFYPSSQNNIDRIDNVIDLKLISVLHEKGKEEQEIFYSIENNTDTYKNWTHNYKQNIMFQIISECEQTKEYCGFNVFIKLSNSNTRRMLEILHYAFGDYDNSGKRYRKISVKRQTDAVNRVANAAFDQISYIPHNGYKAKNLAYTLGNIFREFIKDTRVKRFEVNHFSIKNTNSLKEEEMREIKAVLHDSIVWGVLIPMKVTKVRNGGDIVFDGRDYMLHPIFAPYFKISYRKRQKWEFNDYEVYTMLQPVKRTFVKSFSSNIGEESEESEGIYIQENMEFDRNGFI